MLFTAGSGNTFDAPAVAAAFTVVRSGDTYTPTLTNPGAGYSDGDVITFPGTLFGGTTPANDLQITVTDVSSDSTNSIQSFTSTGRARQGRFISLTNSQYARWSDDAIDWTEVNLSFTGDYRSANVRNRTATNKRIRTWYRCRILT